MMKALGPRTTLARRDHSASHALMRRHILLDVIGTEPTMRRHCEARMIFSLACTNAP